MVYMNGVKGTKRTNLTKFYKKCICLRYSVLFIILSFITFLPFIIEGKSFVWQIDGISQHYPILCYYGKLLRGLISGKGFPMVDFKLGLGFDTIMTLHYYALGDPVSLLAVFMTPQSSVLIYGLLVILRLYLAGLAFLLYAKLWSKNDFAIISGALIYTFCGYSLYAGVRHPFFLNPMIYLPLLFIGIEKLLTKKKQATFILAVFLSAISNFYFFYMLSIIAIIYFIIRYFNLNKKSKPKLIKGFLTTGFYTAGYYLIGLGMAAIVFLPVVYGFLQNGRAESSPKMLISIFHYTKGYYIRLLQGLFATGVSPGYWVNLTYSTVLAASLAVVMAYKKYRKIRTLVIFVFLALSIPAFGFMMNGFAYITNRWVFAVSLVAALVFVLTFEDLLIRNKRVTFFLIIGTAGYGLLAFAFSSGSTVKYEFFILLFVSAVILLLQSNRLNIRNATRELILASLVVFTLAFHGHAYYSPKFHGYVNEFLTKDEVLINTTEGMTKLINNIEDENFYRVETYGDKVRNEALCANFNDVSAYFSIMDKNVTNYYKQLELLDQRNTYRFDNHDNRTVLNALSNVKYFITNQKSAAPYAYKLIAEEEGEDKYYLFENLFWIPFGYTYDYYITEEEYADLNTLEKQNIMLSAVVLENPPEGFQKIVPDSGMGIKKLKTEITFDENIETDNNKIKVKEPGAAIIIDFESEPKSEVYLRLKDFNISRRAATMTNLKVKADGDAAKIVNVRSPYHNTYFRDDYLINTGYSKQSKSRITITFLQKGTFSFNGIDVYNVDMNYYKERIKELGKVTLSNMKMGNNIIEGNVNLDREKIMVFSIPYSRGWRAYVNGKRADILRANTMHMALILGEGENHISLKYRTPFLLEGAIISFASTVIFAFILFVNRRRVKLPA